MKVTSHNPTNQGKKKEAFPFTKLRIILRIKPRKGGLIYLLDRGINVGDRVALLIRK